jgi:hypothetical protein
LDFAWEESFYSILSGKKNINFDFFVYRLYWNVEIL